MSPHILQLLTPTSLSSAKIFVSRTSQYNCWATGGYGKYGLVHVMATSVELNGVGFVRAFLLGCSCAFVSIFFVPVDICNWLGSPRPLQEQQPDPCFIAVVFSLVQVYVERALLLVIE
jgi:hypothetical protein